MSNCTRQKYTMTVMGQTRNVWRGSKVSENKWRARTYVKGRTVSGTVSLYANGALRFTADGKNASLLK